MNRVLIIEDNETLRQGMEQTLVKAGFDIRTATNGKQGLELVQSFDPACVISDLRMDGMDGIAVLQKVRELRPETPVMIITAFGTIEKAVEAMKLGAHDFITKPFPPDLLRVKVRQAVDVALLSKDRDKLFFENQYLRNEAQGRYQSRQLLGAAPAIKTVLGQIERVAPTNTTVFIDGESGTGKELAARAIHDQSARHDKPFIKVNCSALAEGVLESELFGHERGAFTGAIKKKPGRFELADQGTLFLDEIGDIHAAVQLKLLRVLQEREFERVGGVQTIKVDVRIISATNQDLKARVAKGLFREDLYYRLVIMPLHMPSLRDRMEDLPTLAATILERLEKEHRRGVRRIAPKAMELLKKYSWPGNVRELENVLEQLYILTDGTTLEVDNLPIFLKNQGVSDIIKGPQLGEMSLPEILDQTEKQLLKEALQQAEGVKTRMAKLLGVKTSALYYKLEKHGLLDGLDDKEV